MRKTLTVMLLVLSASPLAACKMFWEHDEKPAAIATAPEATDTDLAKADPTTMTEAGKPMEQTASMSGDKPASKTPAVPAKK